MCGMTRWDRQPGSHACRLLSKHDISVSLVSSATLHEVHHLLLNPGSGHAVYEVCIVVWCNDGDIVWLLQSLQWDVQAAWQVKCRWSAAVTVLWNDCPSLTLASIHPSTITRLLFLLTCTLCEDGRMFEDPSWQSLFSIDLQHSKT